MKYILYTISIAMLFLISCSEDDSSNNTNEPMTYESAPVTVGDGTVKTWITTDENDIPLQFGVWISEDALTGLPNENTSFMLNMPSNDEFDMLGIKTIHMDWNPNGHPPVSVYTLPHFDLHFYVISEETKNSIEMVSTAQVDDNYIAPDYMIIDTAYVPMMGAHAVDATAPELHGETFTQTYIYGYYDGNQAFIEPMFTTDYLSTMPDEVYDIKTPVAYSYNGYAPQKISYKYDSQTKGINVILSDLVKTN